MTKETPLLWMDIETTGLDLEECEVLEVGMFLTDSAGRELEGPLKGGKSVLVRPSQQFVDDYDGWLDLKMDNFVKGMHSSNGLLADLRAGTGLFSLGGLESSLIKMLDSIPEWYGRPMLAGSGVSHFDHRLVLRDMPGLAKRLAHNTVDVGVLRRMLGFWCGEDKLEALVDRFSGPKTHRALDDVRLHLAEYVFWCDEIANPETGSTLGKRVLVALDQDLR